MREEGVAPRSRAERRPVRGYESWRSLPHHSPCISVSALAGPSVREGRIAALWALRAVLRGGTGTALGATWAVAAMCG
jgi:hypothetical protein